MQTTAPETPIVSTTTTLPNRGRRSRVQRVRYNAIQPPTSTVAETTLPAEKSKFTSDEKGQHAILFVAGKTHLSTVEIERKLKYKGNNRGSTIAYHISKMKKMKTTMPPELWSASVFSACQQWLSILHKPDPVVDSVAAPMSASDANLGVARRKRKAAEAALEEMAEDSSLSFVDAAEVQRKRFKLQKLSGRTVRNLKKNPKLNTNGRPPAFSPQMEIDLAFSIRYLRTFAIPVYRCDVKTLADKMLLAIPFSIRPFGRTGVSKKWIRSFMQRRGLEMKNQDANDINREFWMTSKNMFDCFLKLAEVAVGIGVALSNPAFVSWEATPKEMPITWIASEMWRVLEFDESACAPGQKSSEKPKGQSDKVVCCKTDGNATTARDSLPGNHISLMITLNFALENLPPGVVYDKGEDVLIGQELTTSDQGDPLTVPCMGVDGLENKEAFYSSNEKGSFDTAKLIDYLRFVLNSMPRKFTSICKGLLFIDGCQTHVSELFISFCHQHHIEVVIKVPYASSKMQSMDAQGGHFVRFKAIYRNNLQKRTASKALLYRQNYSRSGGVKRIAGSLGCSDFVPCAQSALDVVCTRNVHATALRHVGLVPFSMGPAFEMLEKEKVRTRQIDRLTQDTVHAAGASQQLVAFLPEFMGVLPEQQRTENPQHTAVCTAAVLAMEAKADAALLRGDKMTDDDMGAGAARLVVKNWAGLSQQQRNKLYTIGRANKWATQKSGGVFAKFGGHATALDHRVYQQATKARKKSIENNKVRRKATSAAAASAKEAQYKVLVGTKELPGALYLKGIGVRWVVTKVENYNTFKKDELFALAFVDGSFSTIELTQLKKKSKGDLVDGLAAYFTLKQSELARVARTTQGVAAPRLA